MMLNGQEWTASRIAGFLAGAAMVAVSVFFLALIIFVDHTRLWLLMEPPMWGYYAVIAGGLTLMWKYFPRRRVLVGNRAGVR